MHGGSLAAASRQLGVNHSTVFRRLNTFEETLGVRLFERLPSGYALTAEGESIRGEAEAVEQSVLAIERRVAGRDLAMEGDVRITTPANLAREFLAPWLPELYARFPGIRIEIAASDDDFDLARREADIALRATPAPPDWLVAPLRESLPSGAAVGERVQVVSDGFVLATEAVVIDHVDGVTLVAVPPDVAPLVPAASDSVALLRAP